MRGWHKIKIDLEKYEIETIKEAIDFYVEYNEAKKNLSKVVSDPEMQKNYAIKIERAQTIYIKIVKKEQKEQEVTKC